MRFLKSSIIFPALILSIGAQAKINKNSKLFDEGVDKLLNKINHAANTISDANTCAKEFSSLYQVLYNFDSKEVNLPEMSDSHLEDLSKKSFQVRLNLKEQLKRIDFSDEGSIDCLKSSKEMVKALRYVEDYFIEYLYNRNGRLPEEYTTLKGEGVHFLKNKEFSFNSYEDLNKGDVLISRGNAYTSAAIARIGLDDYQFSHMTLIHRDENNELHTSEAHIEIGSVVAPMQVHLDQKNARTVVFRHPDQKLAAAATDYTYNHIKDFKKRRGFNIEYDFGMNLANDVRLFCTEVAYIGYLNASKELYGEELDMPLYKTKFDIAHLRFLKQVGIAVNESNIDTFSTFGPGDIQFDPRFDIVAEWRNPAKLQDSRFKDAILTKIFEWMDTENYYFRTRFLDKVKNTFGWLIRKNKWLASLSGLDKEFPLNMKVKQINIFITLDLVGDAMYAELKEAQAKSETPLTFKELYNVLEEFRIEDLERYKKRKKSAKMHRRFRPSTKQMKNK